jgi:hypothetical protein
MKYRRLHREELEAVREDFVKFLAANSITASDWEALKAAHPAVQAENLIDIFSDIFWEKVLDRVLHVIHFGALGFRAYRADGCVVHLRELRIQRGSHDLSNPEVRQALPTNAKDLLAIGGALFQGKKTLANDDERKLLFFDLIEQGAQPGGEDIWTAEWPAV